jgi:serine/threonine protein kinase/Flp pilus assembly protein TadD
MPGDTHVADQDEQLQEAILTYLKAADGGLPISPQELLKRYPSLTAELTAFFADQSQLEPVLSPLRGVREPIPPRSLGDFQILREVGRGGMGIVYQAEQISLGRRVALKVLPFAATMDPHHLQRFQNEARAAASLEHPHIVPVYGVGCERGVHYYAMKFIEGRTLATLIDEQRTGKSGDGSGKLTTAHAETPLADSKRDTLARATSSTHAAPRDPAYFGRIAEWGIQAAEALEHAHSLGIVHRDIKPANLMIDSNGSLWVTDFGLARTASDAGLTITGDVLGTLRYMSPEQALAKHGLVDHRTDVYSLGVTLYELLTGTPTVEGKDREEILNAITLQEPRSPRSRDAAIPWDLDTIVLRAIAKEAVDRYTTAREFAEDLRNFLESRPLRARRPGLVLRLRKWARRHRTVVWAAAAILLVVAVLGSGIGLWWVRMKADAEGEARAAVREAVALQEEEKWPEALGSARRAQAVLAGVGANRELQHEVDELANDLEMVHRLEAARAGVFPAKDKLVLAKKCHLAYVEVFAWYGLDVDNIDPLKAGEHIRSRSICLQLASALDDWAQARFELGLPGASQLLAISRVADPNSWRNRLRDAIEGKDPLVLDELFRSDLSEDIAPVTAVLLARLTYGSPAAERSAEFLRRVQGSHPADFWVNYFLSYYHATLPRPRWEDALRYSTAAVALRPHFYGGYLNLGAALQKTGHLDEAIAAYHVALRLKSNDYPEAYVGLGAALAQKRSFNEAITAFREAIRLKEDYAGAHINLGAALSGSGNLDEAIEEFKTALSLHPEEGLPDVHFNLAFALQRKGRLDEAIEEYRQTLANDKNYPDAHNNLGTALLAQGKLVEAEAVLREGTGSNDAGCYYNLGRILWDQKKLPEAETVYRKALELNPRYAEAYCNLGQLLVHQGRFTESLEARKKGHELGSKQSDWHYPSGEWVRQSERLIELDAKLPKVLKGEAQPSDVEEFVVLAQICQRTKGLYLAAARLYGDAFTKHPQLANDLQQQHRYKAARTAALAGCHQGKDADQVDDKERTRLRRQALDWLRADLAAYRSALEKEPDKARAGVLQRMKQWQQDKDLDGVRGDSLKKLPEAERQEWQRLWTEVGSLLQSTNEAAKKAGS